MGGSGSGRRSGGQDTTEGYLRLDVRWMQRKGSLQAGHSGTVDWSRNGSKFATISYRTGIDALTLSYRSRERGGDWEDLEYAIVLTRTACYYGGSRLWFRCPARGCGRRVAVLYGGRIFACRQCRGLAYESQQQSPSDRATDRAWALLKRLKCDGWMTIFDSDPPRPTGMHRSTHARLSDDYERSRVASLGRWG